VSETLSWPRSLEKMRDRQKHMMTEDEFKAGLKLELRPTDVVIAPFAKSGTTWTQQIVHTLRTRGDMDFDDISRVIPWIETSAAIGIDLNAEQRAEPRAFKSHLGWDLVPRGGRYINVVRDPADVLVSLYKFNEGWYWEPGTVDLTEYAMTGFLKQRAYYRHLKSWWPRRDDPDVLFLCYERMLAEPRTTIIRIAEFIGVPLDDELLDLTERHASLEFMLEHKDRFDDYLMRKLASERMHLPLESDGAKVREGRAGSGAMLSAEVREKLDELWAEEITAELGFRDYPALIEALERSA
jgi:hypothetical protein